MKRWKKHVAAAVITAAAIGGAYNLTHPAHIGPAALYPSPGLSPGLISTSNLADLTHTSQCGTYSQCHRNTSPAQKAQVRAEYPNCASQNEIDHIVPLALGGADDVRNLWCQPAANDWNGKDYGFHTKDKLEAYLAIQVKSGAIAPKDAQSCILNDWVACFNKYMTGKFGSISTTNWDGEDDIIQ